FLDLWRSAGLTPVPDLELSDTTFDAAIQALLQHRVSGFLDGMPHEVARWIQFQFTPEIVGNHLGRSDESAIGRAGPVAARWVATRQVENVLAALRKLEDESGFRE